MMSTSICFLNRKITTTNRWSVFALMFSFIAWGTLAWATRFATFASAEQSVLDPDQPKIAGHFQGIVTGPDGQPSSGARVYVVPVSAASKGPGPVRAKTDADGRFAFDAPDMTYTDLDGLSARREGLVIAIADGCAPDWMRTWGHRTGLGMRTHFDPIRGGGDPLKTC